MSDTFDFPIVSIQQDAFTLRTLSLDDAPAVFAYASDPEVARYTLWPPHPSLEFTRAFLQTLTGPTFLSWAITLPGTPTPSAWFFSTR